MEKTRLPLREEGFTFDLLVPWTTQWTSCFCLHTSTSLPVPQFLGCQEKNATLTVTTTAQGHLSPDSLYLLSSELQSLGPCSEFLSHLAPGEPVRTNRVSKILSARSPYWLGNEDTRVPARESLLWTWVFLFVQWPGWSPGSPGHSAWIG